MHSRFSFRACALATLAMFLAAGSLRAFDFTGTSWPDGTIPMQLQLGATSTALSDGSASWADVAESALNEWNAQLGRTKFVVVRDSTAAVARGNRINNVIFRTDIYGTAFDSSTLAVTLTSTNTSGAATENDVIFNSNRTWNSYRGALRSGTNDFRRTALHEFGHVLGLDHPDEATPFQNVDTIMSSRVSSVESLRADDIAGVKALYAVATPQNVTVGQSFTASVQTTGAGPFTYNWFYRGTGSYLVEPFQLASTGSYTIGSFQATDAGTYIVTATSPFGVFFSNVVNVAATPVTPSADTIIANISTRGVVGTGDNALIAGFVIGGTTPKPVLIRAAGPALRDFGVGQPLADPVLTINNSAGTVVARNDNWGTAENLATLTAASSRLGAFSFKSGSADAALLVTLAPGSYTALVSGAGDTTGVALVEVYDADPDAATARTHRLVNIATRGQVQSGDDVLIAGLVVSGPGPKTFLIRAVGPTLTRSPFNISGALRDPFLQLYQGSTLLHENDDWDSPFPAQPALRAAAQKVGAFSLQEVRSNSGLDSVMLFTLQPGSYTAKVSGFEGATGVALVEIYEVP